MRGIDAASSYWPGATPTKSLPASLAESKQRRVDICSTLKWSSRFANMLQWRRRGGTDTDWLGAGVCKSVASYLLGLARCEKLACKPGLDLQLSLPLLLLLLQGFFGFGNLEQVPTLK